MKIKKKALFIIGMGLKDKSKDSFNKLYLESVIKKKLHRNVKLLM
jgi:hypothetical protein